MLPDLIEIVPPSGPVRAQITVPGSKSITNRALILAALAEGETVLRGALWSEDTQVMVECLQELGFIITVEVEAGEPSNRVITVFGQGGRIPRGGPGHQPLRLFVGNAGTAARFLAALVALGSGAYELHGVPRMHERPQAALFSALRQLGYRIDTSNERLPAVVHGAGPRNGRCRVAIADSSQFASALLLCARAGHWQVEVAGQDAEESSYIEMTHNLIALFQTGPRQVAIEGDASSASYFFAADWLARLGSPPHSSVTVSNWPQSSWQIDAAFARYLPLPPQVSRRTDLGDSIMTAIVLAPFGEAPVHFTDLRRLRVQECERVQALRTELARCGAVVLESGDTLEVRPSQLHGAVIQTYHDHRIAMCFAILGLKVPGVKIKSPACVKKTFPNFFQKLAAPPPGGLGVRVLEGQTGQPLGPADLFAD